MNLVCPVVTYNGGDVLPIQVKETGAGRANGATSHDQHVRDSQARQPQCRAIPLTLQVAGRSAALRIERGMTKSWTASRIRANERWLRSRSDWLQPSKTSMGALWL